MSKNKKQEQTHKQYVNEANERKNYTNIIASKIYNAVNDLNLISNARFNNDDYNLNKYYKQSEQLTNCCNRFFAETYEMDLGFFGTAVKRKTKPFRTCKSKFCSICTKIRSNKLFHDTHKVITKIQEDKQKFVAYHLTLTVKNPIVSEFNKYYNVMNEALHDMLDSKQKSKVYKLNKYILGWQCAREVTQSKDAKMRDELHPHIHLLLLLDADFVDKYRVAKLTKKDILAEWNNALQAQDPNFPHVTQAHFDKVKPNKTKNNYDLASAIAEVSKYPMKPSDLLNMYDSTLLDLLILLEGRRMVTFGGIIRKYRKMLKLQDVVVDAFIDEDLFKLVSVKLYNYNATNNQFYKQNIKKSDLLEYRILSSSELTELNYAKDEKAIIARSRAVRQYINKDFNELNTKIDGLQEIGNFENIKDSKTGDICSQILELANKDFAEAQQIKEYNNYAKLINAYLQCYLYDLQNLEYANILKTTLDELNKYFIGEAIKQQIQQQMEYRKRNTE